MYPLLIIAVCMMTEFSDVMSDANYKLNSLSNKNLYCIEFTSNYVIRSTVDCALRASQISYYENSFAYRNKKCYLCRADNANCAASQAEFQLVGPHFFKGKVA